MALSGRLVSTMTRPETTANVTDALNDVELVGISLLSVPHHQNCQHNRPIFPNPVCTCRREEVLEAWARLVERLRTSDTSSS